MWKMIMDVYSFEFDYDESD